jgi:hypothetical protein
MNMKKNSVKYLQGISFLLLTYAERTEIKNSGDGTLDFVIPESSSRRKQTHEKI